MKRNITRAFWMIPLLFAAVFALALFCLPQTEVAETAFASSYFSAGQGTESDPYIVATVEDLEELSQLCEAGTLDTSITPILKYSERCYRLGGDVDLNLTMTGFTSEGAPAVSAGLVSDLLEWSPIGTAAEPFSGSFDGAGYAVSGLYINCMGVGVGLFETLDGATVKNLTITKSYVKGASSVGAVLGNATNTTVIACKTTSTVWVQSMVDKAGGIAGELTSCDLYNCVNVARVTANSVAGGLVGNENASSVVNGANFGRVTATLVAGGLVGGTSGGKVENCLNTANVTGGTKGGIVGAVSGAGESLSHNCYVTASGVNTATKLIGSSAGTSTRRGNLTTASASAFPTELEVSDLNNTALYSGDFGTSTSLLSIFNDYALDQKSAGCTGWKTDVTAAPAYSEYPCVIQGEVFSLTLNVNGGTFASSYFEPRAIVAGGNDVTLPTTSVFSRSGYTFGGWYASSDGGVTLSGNALTAVTNATANTSLFAKWTITTPVISSVPDFSATYDNTTKSVNLVAGNGSPTANLSFEWQKRAGSTDLWRAFTAVGPTLSLKNAADSGEYRVRARATDGTDVSAYCAWVSFAVTIAKAPLSVVGNNLEYAYGGTPVFTYTLNGLCNETAEEALQTVPTYIPAKTNAGQYVGEILFSGGTSANYDLTYIGGTLRITKLPLTVTAEAKTAVYGEPQKSLTYVVEGTFVGTDGLSGSLAKQAGSAVGTYEIVQGTLTAGDNYDITYVSAIYTILAKTLTSTMVQSNAVVSCSVQTVSGFEAGVTFAVRPLTSVTSELENATSGEEIFGRYSVSFAKDGAVYEPVLGSNNLYITLYFSEDVQTLEAVVLENGTAVHKETGTVSGKVTFAMKSQGEVVLIVGEDTAVTAPETEVFSLMWAIGTLAGIIAVELCLFGYFLWRKIKQNKEGKTKLYSLALAPIVTSAVLLGELVLTATMGGIAILLGAVIIAMALDIRSVRLARERVKEDEELLDMEKPQKTAPADAPTEEVNDMPEILAQDGEKVGESADFEGVGGLDGADATAIKELEFCQEEEASFDEEPLSDDETPSDPE